LKDYQVKAVFGLALIVAAILMLAVLSSVRVPLVASPILAVAAA